MVSPPVKIDRKKLIAFSISFTALHIKNTYNEHNVKGRHFY